jgi:hypothetical protein
MTNATTTLTLTEPLTGVMASEFQEVAWDRADAPRGAANVCSASSMDGPMASANNR